MSSASVYISVHILFPKQPLLKSPKRYLLKNRDKVCYSILATDFQSYNSFRIYDTTLRFYTELTRMIKPIRLVL